MAKVTNAQLKELVTNNATTTNENFKKAKKAIAGKVDIVEGKGLSTKDFTAELEAKLKALPTNADLQTAIDAKTTMAAVEAVLADYTKTADLPKDQFVQSGTVEFASAANSPVNGLKAGDAYIDLVLANSDNTHIYIPAAKLVDVYTEGTGIKIANNQVSIDSSVVAQKSDISDMASKTWVGEQNYLTEHQSLAGKQDVIDASHKLSADLVDDSGATNKFVTAAEKSKIAEVDNKVEAQDVTDAINDVFGELSIVAWDSIVISE